MDVESLPETALHFYLMVTHRLSPSIKGMGDSQEKKSISKATKVFSSLSGFCELLLHATPMSHSPNRNEAISDSK